MSWKLSRTVRLGGTDGNVGALLNKGVVRIDPSAGETKTVKLTCLMQRLDRQPIAFAELIEPFHHPVWFLSTVSFRLQFVILRTKGM